MLRAGGNAVDAAIAAAWALSVCEPSGSGLGGQTTLLIRESSGKCVVIDGHSHAPAGVSKRSVRRAQQDIGHRACVIPSTVATLAHAQERHGRLTTAATIAPAIRLAEEGYPITRLQRRQQRMCRESLVQHEPTASLFLKDGNPYEIGEVFRQPVLAGTLRRLATAGLDDFYRGEIAQMIVADMQTHDGLLNAGDLERFAGPVVREPLSTTYHGHTVLSVASLGGGEQLARALTLLEHCGRNRDLTNPDEWYFALAETILAVFKERESRSAEFTDKPFDGPVPTLDIRDGSALGEVSRLPTLRQRGIGIDFEEAGETTHLCTADAEGNVVSLTQSIQSLFGAKVANARTGFLYNNYLTTCPRRPHAHRLGSGCRPRSNAAPTLLIRQSERVGSETKVANDVIAIGAAGSRRILTAILQTLHGIVDLGLSPQDAVAQPRIHARLSGRIWIEAPALSAVLQQRLSARFVEVVQRQAHSYSMGAAQVIVKSDDGKVAGGADPRRDGSVVIEE